VGYKRPKKTYTLIFDDPEMEGLEVKTRSTSMGEYFHITKLLIKLQENPEVVPEDLENIEDMFSRFAKVLVSWNLEDEEGMPIPATAQSLLDQDIDFAFKIINAWTDAVGGVDPELGKDSASTPNSPEELELPMEVLSGLPGSM
jgi:hypothetical protein